MSKPVGFNSRSRANRRWLVSWIALTDYRVFTLLTILLGFVYVFIGVGFSAMTRSTTRAAVASFCLLALFWLLWGFIGQLLLYLDTGSLVSETLPGWYLGFVSIPPGPAYGSTIAAVLGEAQFASVETFESQGMVEGSIPFIAEPWFGFVILGFWAFAPLGLGLLSFERGDL